MAPVPLGSVFMVETECIGLYRRVTLYLDSMASSWQAIKIASYHADWQRKYPLKKLVAGELPATSSAGEGGTDYGSDFQSVPFERLIDHRTYGVQAEVLSSGLFMCGDDFELVRQVLRHTYYDGLPGD